MAPTEMHTLSLHDALPILASNSRILGSRALINLHQAICKIRTTKFFLLRRDDVGKLVSRLPTADRKSTRLNSSHLGISYAVFCLKKKTSSHSSHAPATGLG